jgi:hypothetical protein
MVSRRMTRTTDLPAELGFELERFEWTASGRLEVGGRWFGVRGRRFVRPVMNLRTEGRRRRLIAVLDHKPWAPEAEGTWIAAFAWRGEPTEITAARLEVAPDVVLELPSPGDDAAGAILHPRPTRRPAEAERRESPAESPPAESPAAPAPESAPVDPPSPALAEARQQLGEAEARIAALTEHRESAVERANELVRVEGELAAAKGHIERVERDRATAQARAGAAEREAAAARERAAAAERDAATARAAEREGAAAAETLRRRAEAAEGDLAAARDRAEAAERDLAAARERPPADRTLRLERELDAAQDRAARLQRELAAAPNAPRAVPEAVLAARGVAPRHERGWGARAVGLVWIAVLVIVLVVILQLVI